MARSLVPGVAWRCLAVCLAVLLPAAPGVRVGVPEYVSDLVKEELAIYDSEIKSENELDAWGTLQVARKVIYKAARGIKRTTAPLVLGCGPPWGCLQRAGVDSQDV